MGNFTGRFIDPAQRDPVERRQEWGEAVDSRKPLDNGDSVDGVQAGVESGRVQILGRSQSVQVEVLDRQTSSAVFVDEREGWGMSSGSAAQASNKTTNEGCFAGTQIAIEAYDPAGLGRTPHLFT
jgi:hypothetical protein